MNYLESSGRYILPVTVDIDWNVDRIVPQLYYLIYLANIFLKFQDMILNIDLANGFGWQKAKEGVLFLTRGVDMLVKIVIFALND